MNASVAAATRPLAHASDIAIPDRTYEHVAVLMGGFSAERAVSLKSGEACARALEGEGYRVTRIDVDRDVAASLRLAAPNVCFNALHGTFGEDGCVQGVLEMLGIPYTHSGVLASALAMHKARAKEVMAAVGIPVAEGRIVTRLVASKGHPIAPPYVLKPVAEGSSVGVFIVDETFAGPPQQLTDADWPHGDLLLAEAFVPGRELTCAVMGDTPLGVLEIKPASSLKFYNYEAKYEEGGSVHTIPDDLSPDVYRSVQTLAAQAHAALGCRGVSRADFRFDDQPGGLGLICLEVNTQPGMTTTSLVPELAEAAGISFGALVRWIVEDASCMR
ncbi:MAG: D-alanine--D-alanine ligase [Pseudomonadota bacterium]